MFCKKISWLLPSALICFSIPSLLPSIQERLLDCISVVLSKSHSSQGRPVAVVGRGNVMTIPQQVSDLCGSSLVQLALQTLARFNFKVHCVQLKLILCTKFL